MCYLKRKLPQYFWRCALIVLIVLTTASCGIQEAYAVLRQHHDSPGVLRYHSLVSIKDEKGYAWQVLLFKQNYQSARKDLRLRLVGFPSVVELTHPRPLEIITGSGKLLSASDVYVNAPAPNVGEYNLTDIFSKLPTAESIKLYVPISTKQALILNIPSNVVAEWQLLVTKMD
ncbi:MAG: DUF3122 domain-containing protein [Rhizonema sp. PD38]|nr:DUF3122 domain-containing protein [Rhizonema sp. PD38]